MATTKATFGLPEEAVAYLRNEAQTRGISMADVLRQAIGTDKYVREKIASGADVLVKDKDKTVSLVFP